jgi:hypothetical protein
MLPVDQTTYGPTHGNCISACVASILELPIEVVPYFIDEHWWERLVGWLTTLGLIATAVEDRCPPGYAIAFGPSRRLIDRGHACVAIDGVIVHDPHPSREGLPIVFYYVVIRRKMP